MNRTRAFRGLPAAEALEASEAFEKALTEISNAQFVTYFTSKVTKAKTDGTSPIVTAISQRKAKLVEFLVNQGADVNRVWTGLSQEHPITLIAHFGLYSLIPLFISKGATPHFDFFSTKPVGDAESQQGRHEPIFAAAQSAFDAKETVLALLDAGVSVNAKDATGKRLIDWTASHNNPSLVSLLIERGADPTPLPTSLGNVYNQVNPHNDTYVHALARSNAFDVLKDVKAALEKKGAFTSFDDIKNCDGETPLHTACQQDALEAVEFLIKEGRCDPNIRSSCYDCTAIKRDDKSLCFPPLFYAINKGSQRVAKALLDAGARPDSFILQFPPLPSVSSLVSMALAKADDFLTRHDREELIAQDLEKKFLELRQYSLDASATVKYQIMRLRKEIEDKKRLAKDLKASATGAAQIASLLVAACAESKTLDLEIADDRISKAENASPLAAADDNGMTTLHWACRSQAATVGIIKALLQLPGVKESINAKTSNGETPLSLLSVRADKNVIPVGNLLVSAGADVNAVNVDNKSILIRACQTMNIELISVLLDSGAVRTQETLDAFDETLRRWAEDEQRISVELYKSVSLAGKVPKVHVPPEELPLRGAILKVREELKKIPAEDKESQNRESAASTANKKKKKRK